MANCLLTSFYYISCSRQKTLRGSKVGIGTLTKKMKAPEITEEDKLKAAVETQKNAVKASVIDLWRRLQVGILYSGWRAVQ